jgi:hypothetical protein
MDINPLKVLYAVESTAGQEIQIASMSTTVYINRRIHKVIAQTHQVRTHSPVKCEEFQELHHIPLPC